MSAELATATATARVLFVDDEVARYDEFIRQMVEHGIEVVTALDAQEAIQLFSSQYFDLVIIDIMLPNPDTNLENREGGKIVRRIRDLTTNCKVLIFSNLSESEIGIELRTISGGERYVGKNDETQNRRPTLVSIVRDMLDNKHWEKTLAPKFDALVELAEGWDGYHAAAISFRVINAAKDFIGEIGSIRCKPPILFPTPSGGIQFEWHSGSTHLEVKLNESCMSFVVQLYGSEAVQKRGEPLEDKVFDNNPDGLEQIALLIREHVEHEA